MTAVRDDVERRRITAVPGAADWLGLAAAPTFAVMALLTSALSGGADVMGPAAHGVAALSGMIPMYVLMSVFHSVPWVKLIRRRRSVARRTPRMNLCPSR
ncbi:MAG: hypothetical protein ACREE5_08620 [Acetobacteraceae bacterium]